jgi:hypothetical protein
MASYTGKRTSLGGIPLDAWSRLKRPYLDLVSWLEEYFHPLLPKSGPLQKGVRLLVDFVSRAG